jgi:uncharacterized membrane-anchored protein
MPILRLRRRPKAPTAVAGPAKVDRRTKDMIRRLEPGDIAVIDHVDLDRVAADGLIEAGVIAVVNGSESISGRYPNGGPIRVVRAGIPLLDAAGTDLLERVHDADTLRIVDGEIWRDDELLATAKVLTEPEIESAMDDARAAIGAELERFADNTLEYVRREARLTFEPLTLPPLHTKFAARHALVVVRERPPKWDWVVLMVDVLHPDWLMRLPCKTAVVRVPGKHRTRDAAWEAFEDMIATRH